MVYLDSIGCDSVGSIDQQLCCPLERQNQRWYDRTWECFMKDITAALLAIAFVLYSLIALLSVELNQDSMNSPLVSNQERISEIGLRVAFQR